MNKQFISIVIFSLIASIFSLNVFAAGNVQRGMKKYKVCVACHGEKGEGIKLANAPRISGQQSWYIKRQLYNFKHGIRGNHIEDITGMQMRTMAMTLYTENDIDDIVAYIVTLNGRAKNIGIKGNTSTVGA